MRNSIKKPVSLLLFLSAIFCTAQVTKTNNTQGTFLQSSGTRTLTFEATDFGANPTVDNVTVLIEFSSEDDGTFGFTFHEDLAFRLESPSGTTVDLVYDVRGIFTGNTTQSPTYGGFNPSGTVQVTFDDNATQSVASSPGGDPTTGTFVPIEPLSSFIGESPIGDWTLHVADSFDNGFNDQLLFFFASITISVPTLSLEVNDNTNFSVYPTVAENYIHLEYSEDTDYATEIYNVLGKKVWSSKNRNTNRIDISTFETGIYFVSIATENKKLTKKFIKK